MKPSSSLILRRVPVALVFALASVVMGSQATSADDASTCRLGQAAFCDTFTTVYDGGRSGQLDPTRWSVARETTNWNPSQGSINTWPQTNMELCDKDTGPFVPSADVRVCNHPDPGEEPYFDEAFNDGESFILNSFRPRQPFDFAGRTGTVAWDVDAKTRGGHSWWTDFWITDQPIPAPMSGGLSSLPRNGVGVDFSGCDGTGPNLMGVSQTFLVSNYVVKATHPNWPASGSCATTQAGVRNHFELHVSQQNIDIFASDAGGANLHLIASQPVKLPFTRGYVHFEHVQYNAAKGGDSAQHHYEWGNVAFDGPVLGTPLGYDVPDALGRSRDGRSVNLGYRLAGGIQEGTMQTCCDSSGSLYAVPPFVLHGVNVSGASEALLNFGVGTNYKSSTNLNYRFNGGPWTAVEYPFPDTFGTWRAMSVTVPLTDLVSGDNTLEFAATQPDTSLINIDLTLNGAGLSTVVAPAVETPEPHPLNDGSSDIQMPPPADTDTQQDAGSASG